MNQPYARLIAATPPLSALAVLLFASLAHAEEFESTGPNRVPARAGTFALKLEPGVAVALTSPQSGLFDVGGGETIKALWALSPNWDIGPSVTFLELPASDSVSKAGTAWTFGGSVRLKRAHHSPDNDSFLSLSPWVDLDALYVRTGERDRFGFAAAVGLAAPLGEDRNFWLGPFVRYLQVIQGTPAGYDNHDARILSLGISLEVGPRVRHEYGSAPFVMTPAPVAAVAAPCPDRDGDGMPDSVDRCPGVAGVLESYGCRPFAKIVVKPDKLELKEKLYFAWDQDTLQAESHPVLDEVVQALKDNRQFRVQVEGHASSDGTDDHNQSLSSRRAQAVLEYLVSHGIERDRLSAKGFASSTPNDTNSTAAGRENNRRVEFVVYFTILGDGGKSQ